MVKQYVYPNRYVHITRKDLGKRVKLRKSKGFTPSGVSFAPTVRNALEGVPFYYTNNGDWKRRRRFVKEGNEWNVYTPVRKRKAVIPSTIDDFKRTRERRVLSKVDVKKIGKIKVKVGNNRWEYHWIK
jgi:hypothetical protein